MYKETIYRGLGGKRNMCEYMPSSAHNDQPRSINNIKCSSKTTFLKGSKSYRLVSTFVRSCHPALTVRPYH